MPRKLFTFLFLTFLLITTSCDSGRAIDEEERRRVLYKHGDLEDKTDVDADFVLIRNGFTSQSEYQFAAYYTSHDWSYAGVLNVESLIRLDGKRNPVVSVDLMRFEIPCNGYRTDNSHCISWSRTFKTTELFHNVPDFDLTITFLPSYQYALHLRSSSKRLQKLAQYQTFKMILSSRKHQLRTFLVKQRFYNSQNLIPGLGKDSFPSNNVSTQDAPFLDLIFYNHPFFPSPRAELSVLHFKRIQQGAQVLELQGHFHNHLTDEAEDYTYILEML